MCIKTCEGKQHEGKGGEATQSEWVQEGQPLIRYNIFTWSNSEEGELIARKVSEGHKEGAWKKKWNRVAACVYVSSDSF